MAHTGVMATPPPPTGPAASPPRSPRRQLRNIGLLSVLSAPVTGFVVWILVAILVGEEKLESAEGQTGLGLALFATPVVIGLAITAWAQFATTVPPLPKLVTVAKGSIGGGVLLLVIGMSSLITAADASIGGALLVIAGLVLAGTGVALIASARKP